VQLAPIRIAALLFSLILVAPLAVGSGPPGAVKHAGWSRYVVAGGRCSVLMPSKPKEYAQDTPGPQFTTHMKIARSTTLGRAYSVLYIYFAPRQSRHESTAKRFADLESGLASPTKQIVRKTELNLQGWPGREYVIRYTDKPVTTILRTFLVGDTIYEVDYLAVITHRAGDMGPSDAARFLRSFTLLPPSRH
jgi:hypothetical protein